MSSVRGEAALPASDGADASSGDLAVAIACCSLLCAQGVVLLVYRPWGFLYGCTLSGRCKRGTPLHRSPPKMSWSFATCRIARWPHGLLAYRLVIVMYMVQFSLVQLAQARLGALKFYTVW